MHNKHNDGIAKLQGSHEEIVKNMCEELEMEVEQLRKELKQCKEKVDQLEKEKNKLQKSLEDVRLQFIYLGV